MAKDQEVTIEHLATYSTMKAIIRVAKNMIKNYGEEMPSKEECKVAFNHAQYIIEDFAFYLVENYKPKQKAGKLSASKVIFEDYTGEEENQVLKNA